MPKREAVARPGEGGKSTFAAGACRKGTLSDLDAMPLPARGATGGSNRPYSLRDPGLLGPGFGAG